ISPGRWSILQVTKRSSLRAQNWWLMAGIPLVKINAGPRTDKKRPWRFRLQSDRQLSRRSKRRRREAAAVRIRTNGPSVEEVVLWRPRWRQMPSQRENREVYCGRIGGGYGSRRRQ